MRQFLYAISNAFLEWNDIVIRQNKMPPEMRDQAEIDKAEAKVIDSLNNYIDKRIQITVKNNLL
jgi:hypothetical protein